MKAAVDIERAKKLAKYSNVAYCSERTVSNWDCNYCEDELRNFRFVKWLAGAFDTQGTHFLQSIFFLFFFPPAFV